MPAIPSFAASTVPSLSAPEYPGKRATLIIHCIQTRSAFFKILQPYLRIRLKQRARHEPFLILLSAVLHQYPDSLDPGLEEISEPHSCYLCFSASALVVD